MEFRTPIDIKPNSQFKISHDSSIFMVGSCFTDNIGALLERDGFKIIHNPMGPLYNPASIYNFLSIAYMENSDDLNFKFSDDGMCHCLDFYSKYCDQNPQKLKDRISDEVAKIKLFLQDIDTMIITLGTAYVYYLNDYPYGSVGNCHKFPASDFTRSKMSVSDVKNALSSIASLLPAHCNIIFTVSPIRHLGDGMHENQISKATLLLGINEAIDKIKRMGAPNVTYFPSYEIMMDDLRDYRFYASDMKHPSEVAIDYIYSNFCDTYMSAETKQKANLAHKAFMRQSHRQIIDNKQ